MNFRSLSTKMTLFVLAVAGVVAVGLAGLAYYRLRVEVVHEIERELAALAEGRSTTIQEWIGARKAIVTATAELLGENPKPALQLAAKSSAFEQVYVGYADRRMIYASEQQPPPGFDPTARPWYQKAAATRRTIVSQPFISTSTKNTVLTVAAPVVVDGKVHAVVGANLPLDALLKGVLSVKLDGSGHAFLVERSGLILVHPKAEFVSKPFEALVPGFPTERLLQLAESKGLTPVTIGGEARQLMIYPIAGTDWLVGFVVDWKAAMAPLDELLLGLVAILTVLLVAAIVLTVAGMRRLLHRPLAAAVKVTDAVARGDLTARATTQSRDEIGQLLDGMQRMSISLERIVGTIRTAASTIASESEQIAAGNADLSQRTEAQAASLEETAASMEELTSAVQQNADNARQANQLAASASEIATHGGEVVREVVTTMNSISESSRKIADIIGVIDGIAFQTNILALNAAVEAARAGEQGRGFAVVASEVRALAQRSAGAAGEIKHLITDSVNKVASGSRLVDEAGHTIDNVVAAVRRVTDIMAEIAAASQEQNAGIVQVGEAVTQMDAATQQNAALVEQSAAAARALEAQARELVREVAVFKLAAGASAGEAPGTVVHARTVREAAAPALRPADQQRRQPGRATAVSRLSSEVARVPA